MARRRPASRRRRDTDDALEDRTEAALRPGPRFRGRGRDRGRRLLPRRLDRGSAGRAARPEPRRGAGLLSSSYDLFRVEGYTIRKFFGDDPEVRIGDSFRRPVRRARRAVRSSRTKSTKGDITAIGWGGGADRRPLPRRAQVLGDQRRGAPRLLPVARARQERHRPPGLRRRIHAVDSDHGGAHARLPCPRSTGWNGDRTCSSCRARFRPS